MSPRLKDRFLMGEFVRSTEKPEVQTEPLQGHPSITRRDEANVLTAYAFRNGSIEDIHSRGGISDPEVRKLMIESSAKIARLLWLRDHYMDRMPELYFAFLEMYGKDNCAKWEREKLTE